MKKRISTFILCFIAITILLATKVNGDMGPKPSTVITFENMGDEVCYGTLLSKDKSNGPWSEWDGTEEELKEYASQFDFELDYEVLKKFIDYKDKDGYYFWMNANICNETKTLEWTYYPPETFKILLYYPDTDTFVESDICERYAFDSYYTVYMDGTNITSIESKEQYRYALEIFSLICRILITIMIEIGIAYLFGFGKKNLIRWIIGINIITQVILNVLLNLFNYKYGGYAFVFYYIVFEIIVFLIEAILYSALFNRISEIEIPKSKAIIYALVANVVSFMGGMFISRLFPDIYIF